MIIINNKKILIDLEIDGQLERLIVIKKALLSLLINIDVENHTDSLTGDITEIAHLLNSMEFTTEQASQIQFAINGNIGLQKSFAAA